MDRNDGLRAIGYGAGDGIGVEIERLEVDVDEYRGCTETYDRAGRRKERERRRDDLVARSNVEAHQRQQQCVGPGRHRDRMGYAQIVRQLVFERVDFGSKDEPLAGGDARHRCEEIAAKGLVLRRKIEQWNLHFNSSATHRSAAAPSPYSGGRCAGTSRRMAATMRSESVPVRMFHPCASVSVHSVASRTVTHGTPSQYASFCRPPEQVTSARDARTAAIMSRYDSGSDTATLQGTVTDPSSSSRRVRGCIGNSTGISSGRIASST